jgi:hypothetical protein
MKNIKEILNHLELPYNDKIKMQKCLKLLTQGLPIHYKNNILYMYLKGETLYFVTKHQAINFELYQKLNDIKLMLRLIQTKMNRCKSVKISNIKAYTTYTKKNTQPTINSNTKFYLKKPKGDFENLATNKKIYKAFEEIREIIKNR